MSLVLSMSKQSIRLDSSRLCLMLGIYASHARTSAPGRRLAIRACRRPRSCIYEQPYGPRRNRRNRVVGPEAFVRNYAFRHKHLRL
jgi:hypothetical protein